MEIAGEFFHGSRDVEEIVFWRPHPSRPLAADQPEFAIRVPVAMGDPPAEKPDFTRKRGAVVAFRLAGLEELLDFGTQAGREFFIRIEGQHPRMRAMREGGILLIAVAQPVLMDDARPGAGGHVPGSVGTAAVHHNNFRRQSGDRRQTTRQIAFLVARDDGNGQRGHHPSPVMVMWPLAKPKVKKPLVSFDKAR